MSGLPNASTIGRPVRLGHFRCYFDKSSNKCELDHTGERWPREAPEASFGICLFMPFPTRLAPSRRCTATWGSCKSGEGRIILRATCPRLHLLRHRHRPCRAKSPGSRVRVWAWAWLPWAHGASAHNNEERHEPSAPVHRFLWATRSSAPNPHQ
jgi:hypothetical protein